MAPGPSREVHGRRGQAPSDRVAHRNRPNSPCVFTGFTEGHTVESGRTSVDQAPGRRPPNASRVRSSTGSARTTRRERISRSQAGSNFFQPPA